VQLPSPTSLPGTPPPTLSADRKPRHVPIRPRTPALPPNLRLTAVSLRRPGKHRIATGDSPRAGGQHGTCGLHDDVIGLGPQAPSGHRKMAVRVAAVAGRGGATPTRAGNRKGNRMPVLVALAVAGLALLTVAADQLIIGAGRLATRLGVSPGVVGVVVIGLGTSAPESRLGHRRGDRPRRAGRPPVPGPPVIPCRLGVGVLALRSARPGRGGGRRGVQPNPVPGRERLRLGLAGPAVATPRGRWSAARRGADGAAADVRRGLPPSSATPSPAATRSRSCSSWRSARSSPPA
jgi:hypothetical protein